MLRSSMLQTYYDEMLPGNSTHYYKFDQYDCEMKPYEFIHSNVEVVLSKDLPYKSKRDCLTLVLRTSMPWTRVSTQRDA